MYKEYIQAIHNSLLGNNKCCDQIRCVLLTEHKQNKET